MEELFLFIESQLGTTYVTSFQDMDDSASGALGIFMYQGEADIQDLSGEYVYECMKVHLQLNCEQNEDAIFSGSKYLRDTVEAFESFSFNGLQPPNIDIVDAQHIGPKVVPIGKNKNGLHVLRTVLQIKYCLTA